MAEKDFSLSPGPLRSDALLIRHLAKPGAISIPGHRSFNVRTVYPKLAQTYRALQLFILPDNIPWLFEHEDTLVPFLFHRLRRPFDDLILDFPIAGKALFRHALHEQTASNFPAPPQHLWVRVRSALDAIHDPDLIWPAEFLQQPIAKRLDELIPHEDRDPPGAPISQTEIGEDATHWILCELWYLGPTGVSQYPRWILIPQDDPSATDQFHYFEPPEDGAQEPTWYRGEILDPNPGPPTDPPSFEAVLHYLLLLDEAHAKTILLALVYLTEFATLLRVSPPLPQNQKEQKTILLKPWLVPRQHAIISIDPSRLAEYHHPAFTQTINVRHAPRPHNRRGHWRNLPEGMADSRTWIRPTWVGDREWQDAQGNTYVFIPPNGETGKEGKQLTE